MNANEISLKKFFTYTSSVYDIDGNFKGVNRKNFRAKTKASTVAKIMFTSMLCGYKSINMLINTNLNKKTRFNTIHNKREYVPKMHGLRECIMDTDYQQLENLNRSVIQKAKENKVFRKNKVDDLIVTAYDGVELSETRKEILGLPEREYDDGKRSYIKHVCAMNVGPNANIVVNTEQLVELEKVTTKKGRERAKTTGETKLFESMFKDTEKIIGGSDVCVFDALFQNKNVMNLISSENKFFVIRMKDEFREIYQDAKGLFEHRKPDEVYELVEHIMTKNMKYSKAAKKKDVTKTKVRIEKRKKTDKELGSKILINSKTQEKKNSKIKITEYERVITTKEVWSDEFELEGFNYGKVRVIYSRETNFKNGKKSIQEIYVITNMLTYPLETILKIMHLRWNIENCGFRTLKQRYHLGHLFIGEMNAINYIVQMIILAFNLFELYTKMRLKEKNKDTWEIITKIFEVELRESKELKKQFNNSS